MILAGKEVVFRLSPEGERALTGMFPASFRARVMDEDQLGVWVVAETEEPRVLEESLRLVLLKWDYFSTAALRSEPEEPEVRAPVGFR